MEKLVKKAKEKIPSLEIKVNNKNKYVSNIYFGGYFVAKVTRREPYLLLEISNEGLVKYVAEISCHQHVSSNRYDAHMFLGNLPSYQARQVAEYKHRPVSEKLVEFMLKWISILENELQAWAILNSSIIKDFEKFCLLKMSLDVTFQTDDDKPNTLLLVSGDDDKMLKVTINTINDQETLIIEAVYRQPWIGHIIALAKSRLSLKYRGKAYFNLSDKALALRLVNVEGQLQQLASSILDASVLYQVVESGVEDAMKILEAHETPEK